MLKWIVRKSEQRRVIRIQVRSPVVQREFSKERTVVPRSAFGVKHLRPIPNTVPEIVNATRRTTGSLLKVSAIPAAFSFSGIPCNHHRVDSALRVGTVLMRSEPALER